MKKAFVLLLCVLAVFAIVSCKNEPKSEPQPEPKETFVVSFETAGGSAIDSINVEKDAKAVKPADPTKDYYDFVGWFDENFETEFNFDDAITEATTIYAKWAPASTTIYKLTGVADNDRFQLRFKASGANDFLTSFKAGDVVSYQFKSTPVEGSTAVSRLRVRGASNYGGTSDFSAGIVASEADADGWITVTCTFATGMDFTENGLLLDLRRASGAGNIVAGDVVEIKNLEFNGKAISWVKDSSSAGPYEGCTPTLDVVTTPKAYKLTATKGGAPEGDTHNYDFDKFSLYWNPNVQVKPGDVFTITFKPERTDDLTKERDFTYSIRDAKKWFSEKGVGSAYPQFWSTFDDSDPDGWIVATYVFPAADAATKEVITYPATFRVDFRDEYLASPTEGRIADVLYFKNATLKSAETGDTVELILDQATSSTKYAAPTIEVL